MKQSIKRMISLVLSFIMIVSICPVMTFAADGEDFLSVEQNLVATVSYGTTLEEAKAELPTNVTAKVKDITPFTEVDTLEFDFDDNTAPGWTLLSDQITLSDGKMNFTNNTNIKAVVGSEDMTDYVVEADLQILEGNPTADVGIMFRTSDATDSGADSYNGYYAGIGVLSSGGDDKTCGVKIGYADGKWHEVNRTVMDIDASKEYTLRVIVYGTNYYVLLKESSQADNEFNLIYSGTQEIYEKGCVGLRSYKQSFAGDNFVVRAITDQDLLDCGIVRTNDVTVPVTAWECADYNGEVAGQYTFVGTVDGGEEYANPDDLTAKATVTVKSAPEPVDHVQSVPFSQVTVEDSYWSNQQKQFICKVIPVAIKNISTGSGGMLNFKVTSEYLATKEGNYTTDDAPNHQGAIYVDSDDYKVIEAMCYALQLDANGDEEILAGQAAIKAQLEEWIPWIVGSQEADGYLYTAYTLTRSNAIMRFNGRSDDMPVHTDGSLYDTVGTDEYNANVNFRSNHELYCAGHFYEAAVAHYRATGDFRLLDVAVKNADLVVRTFGYDEGEVFAVPGHQEIELALIKLANLCSEIGVANGVDYGAKAGGYIETSKFFLDAKGADASEYDGINSNATYYQNEAPVADQRTAHGHAVRAQYLYTAMADVALMEVAAGNENPYDAALQAIYEDSLTKQYIHGGIGIPSGEAFSESYQLPNDGAYCETCAQISNVMWNQRMNLLYGDSEHTDLVEWVIYNSVMSCINLDGDRFFYQNHLTSDSDFTRSVWFGTACCPPNLMRTVMAIGGYIYAQDESGNVTVNQYIGNTADLNIAGNLVNISMAGSFPWDGDASLTVNKTMDEAFSISFRIPDWATHGNTIKLNGEEISAEPNEQGYVVIDRVWAVGDKVELSFPMEAERIYSDPNVVENEGLVAVRRGPIIYTAESPDNEGVNVRTAILPEDAELVVSDLQQLPGRDSEDPYGIENVRLISYTGEYGNIFGDVKETSLTLIPYYVWNNRGYSDMSIYLTEATSIDLSHPLEYYATPSASHTSPWGDTPAHLNNGTSSLTDSSTAGNDRWSSYGAPTNENWVEYAFDGEVLLRGSWVSWFDDGGGCQAPTGLTIKYWDGEVWQDVTNLTGTNYFPKNNFKTVQGEGYYGFDEIVTTKIRLYPTNPNTTSTKAQPAIVEWRLDGEVANGANLLPKEYEAEGGTVSGIARKQYTINNNVSANGYVGMIDNEESSVTMEVYAPIAGVYDMLIKYSGSTQYPNTSHKYYANGDVESAQIVQYEQKKGFSNWYTQTARIALEEGTNTITFTHSGIDASFAQLDAIVLAKANAAQEVIDLINAIGEVTLESGDAVTAAKDAYNALPLSEKERVTNAEVLIDAVQTYTILVAEDFANKAAESAAAAQKAYEDAIKAAEEAKAQVAEDKAAAEAAQAEAEAAKAAAEEALAKAEAAKAAAEAAKAAAEEANIKAAEEAAEAAREAAKAAADAAKVAELAKAVAEAQAKTQEAQAAAEAAQKAAEEAQKAAEEAQKQAAEDKDNAEAAKAEAEAAQKAAEAAKAEAEAAQKEAEAAQAAAEAAQKAAEAERNGAEDAKEAAEAAKAAAEALKKEAEAAKEEAAKAKAEAEAAQKAAEEAKAEAAKQAEEARKAAELATAKAEALIIIASQSDLIDNEELTKHQLTEYKNAISDAITAVMAAEDEEAVDAAVEAMEAALEAALASCPAAKYVDINADDWYHDNVDFVAGNGYMTGTSETTFSPFDNTSRAMLVTVLYRIAGSPDVEGLEIPFEDTLEDVWYSDAILWGYNEGIVTGYSDTTFGPEDPITREQLVTMLYRYAKYSAEDVSASAELDKFPDAASVSEYALDAVKWAVANEILTGKDGGPFIEPYSYAARVECAAIIARFLSK